MPHRGALPGPAGTRPAQARKLTVRDVQVRRVGPPGSIAVGMVALTLAGTAARKADTVTADAALSCHASPVFGCRNGLPSV